MNYFVYYVLLQIFIQVVETVLVQWCDTLREVQGTAEDHTRVTLYGEESCMECCLFIFYNQTEVC